MPLSPKLRFVALPSEHLHFTVIAIDPGVTTGWAMFVVKKFAMLDPNYKIMDNVVCWRGEDLDGDENEQVRTLLRLIRSRPQAHVVIEDFTLRKFTRDRELLAPVRIGAKIEYGMFVDRRKVNWQQPALAKTTLTDERLKALGLWAQMSPHTRDSIRHALTYLRRVKS
jgi:hypothetical protein